MFYVFPSIICCLWLSMDFLFKTEGSVMQADLAHFVVKAIQFTHTNAYASCHYYKASKLHGFVVMNIFSKVLKKYTTIANDIGFFIR